MSKNVYGEDDVWKMLIAAFDAGFNSPSELKEEICREILEKHTGKGGDLKLMFDMQKLRGKDE